MQRIYQVSDSENWWEVADNPFCMTNNDAYFLSHLEISLLMIFFLQLLHGLIKHNANIIGIIDALLLILGTFIRQHQVDHCQSYYIQCITLWPPPIPWNMLRFPKITVFLRCMEIIPVGGKISKEYAKYVLSFLREFFFYFCSYLPYDLLLPIKSSSVCFLQISPIIPVSPLDAYSLSDEIQN